MSNKIHFTCVRAKNFMSIGNYFIEYQLDSVGMTLCLGFNGSGKTSLIEMISFGLFGRSWRGIKKNSIINSRNKKDLIVEVEFIIGGKNYKIVRGLKPNILELYCNGEAVNQSSSVNDFQTYIEKYIYQLNFKSFSQIVMVGTSTYIPFMQLPSASRREIIEDLLGLKVFSTMNSLLKEDIAINKQSLSETEFEIKVLEEKINIQKANVKQLLKEEKARKKKSEVEKAEIQQEISSLMSRKDNVNSKIKAVEEDIDKLNSLRNKLQTYEQKKREFIFQLDKQNKDIKDYSKRKECPVCFQKIDEEHRNKHVKQIEDIVKKLNEGVLKIDKQIQTTENKINLLSKIEKTYRDLNDELYDIDIALSKHQGAMKIISVNNESIAKKNVSVIKSLENELTIKKSKFDTLTSQKELLFEAQLLLKDSGIKSSIIEYYIPIINSLVSKNLEKMEFNVSFELDSDFNEVIKSRHYDEFSISNFSQGEKTKIDLALLMAWREVAALKNSISTNLLIMDEIMDASLDNDGCDLFLDSLSELKDANIFIISHRGEGIFDKFDKIIEVYKTNGFTHTREINEIPV